MQTKLGELTQAILSNSSTGSLSRVGDALEDVRPLGEPQAELKDLDQHIRNIVREELSYVDD